MDAEESARKREILAALKRRRDQRELQKAKLGVNADPVIITEIEDLESEINRLESELLSSTSAASTTLDAPSTIPMSAPSLGATILGAPDIIEIPSRTSELPSLQWPDGSTMLVLPAVTSQGNAICISKQPITNAQYREFVNSGHGSEPTGEHYRNRQWLGPFSPWKDIKFSHPDQPVVCVSFSDATAYCQWIDTLLQIQASTTLPDTRYWDFAAFGSIYPNRSPKTWMNLTARVHPQALAPAVIDKVGTRTNGWGFADMVGNVWEWCGSDYGYVAAVLGPAEPNVELRGGGFLDNLWQVLPFLTSYALKDDMDTRHSDLGFRIAAELRVLELPQEIRDYLTLCPSFDELS